MKFLLSKAVALLCAASALANPRRGPEPQSTNLARQTQNNGRQDIVSAYYIRYWSHIYLNPSSYLGYMGPVFSHDPWQTPYDLQW
jgi:hypothetical protein